MEPEVIDFSTFPLNDLGTFLNEKQKSTIDQRALLSDLDYYRGFDRGCFTGCVIVFSATWLPITFYFLFLR